MAQDTSAYKFSLFDSYDYGSAAPELEPEYEPYKEPRKKVKRRSGKSRSGSSRSVTMAQKRATHVSTVRALKVLVVVVFIFAMMCVPMYINVKIDETSKSIAAVQKDIDIAKSENVRLESALKAMVSIDRVENYAVNNLGMVKLENYRITYFESDNSDQVVISGGKTYRNND